jgi:hypothetical protein
MNWWKKLDITLRVLVILSIPGVLLAIYCAVFGTPSWVFTTCDLQKEMWLNVWMLMVPAGVICYYVEQGCKRIKLRK